MHFQLVDHVIERTADQITAVKAVSAAEEYLQDHFPGFPVLPGVLMLESLVQAGRLLVADRCDAPLVLAQVRNIRYGNMVKPGQSLQIQVTLRKQGDDSFEFEGVGKVNDQVAVQGRFQLAPVPAAA